MHHSITGAFAIREGNWKLCLAPGSAGWSAPRPGQEPPDAPRIQLFDLSDDIGEKNNVQAQHPDIVARLIKMLEQEVADGRSTAGAPQPNTVTPDIQSGAKATAPKGKGKGKPNAD